MSDASGGKITVKRVTLPRYEVLFSRGADALDVAREIKVSKLFQIDHEFPESLGQEIVLDMCLNEATATATLLFRVIQRLGTETVLEWWPRRKTDPELLEMWIEWLDENNAQAEGYSNYSLAPSEIFGLLELCRRSLAANPFVALNLHWGASEKEVKQAHQTILASLLMFKNTQGAGQRAEEMLTRAREAFQEACDKLSSQAGRMEERERYIADHTIAHAVELSRSKMHIAKMRGDEDAYREARDELKELTGR